MLLDEPSIGLHPSNIVGLNAVMHDLIADGNSVLLVDHDTQILKESDWIIEMGPEAGAGGGHVIAQGTIPEIAENKASMIGPFLSGKADAKMRKQTAEQEHVFNGNHSSVYGFNSYGKATGGRYSQRTTDRCDRCIRFW